MLKSLAVVLSAALIGASASREPEPIAPAGGIALTTRVGEVGGTFFAIEVSVAFSMSRQGIEECIRFGGFLQNGAVPITDAEPLALCIEAAADAAVRSASFEQRVGALTVRTETLERLPGMGIRVRGQSIKDKARLWQDSDVALVVDADNAPTLARLLRRAESNAAWLRPRLKDLDPSAP